jgi:hypothetical protein
MINQLLSKRPREEDRDSRPSKRPNAPASTTSALIDVPAFATSGISLTSVRDATDLLSNQDTVTLAGILGMERDLVSMFQFNYMLELDYFLRQLNAPNCKTTFVIHGK